MQLGRKFSNIGSKVENNLLDLKFQREKAQKFLNKLNVETVKIDTQARAESPILIKIERFTKIWFHRGN